MAQFEVQNLTDAFGVRVTGLDLTQEFDDDTRGKLRALFDQRGALVFSGLDIPTVDQDRLCRMLCGDDERDAGKRDPQYVSNSDKGGYAPYGRLLFHGDMMWHPKPFQVLSLYGQKVEPGSATTSLASGVTAWKKLPAELRDRVEKLEVVHTTGTVFSRGGDELLRSDRENEISTAKPIKLVHPRTGESILYVSQQTTRQVVGYEPEESEAFLQLLFSYLYAPDNVYEHTWADGDMLVFDNIALQHARGNVLLDGPKRTLRKVIAPVPKVSMEAPTFEKTRATAA
jgi:alpha-ketoglutarate-dependent taurine dioxygenase